MHYSQNLIDKSQPWNKHQNLIDKSQPWNKHLLIIVYNFFRDIGIEAIKRGGFAKFVDVRHLEGYPDVGRLESKG